MSDSESEKDIFKSKPRIDRSPKRATRINESGFISDFMNVSKNCEKLENPVEKNITQTQTGQSTAGSRKSVSFQTPTTSSTFYNPGNDSNFDLLDLSTDGNFNTNLGSANQFDNSLLDPFAYAQLTYSDLADSSNVHLSETDLRNRPFTVLSLVYLAQTVCTNNNIDCSGALAESSGWKHLFENRFHINETNNLAIQHDTLVTIQTPGYHQTEEMAGSLSVHSIVRGIDRFESRNREEVESFIANVELFHELSGNSDELKLIVLKTVKSRLKAITILGNVQSLTLVQIIARIREKFKLSMTFDAAQEKLLAIQQTSKETIDSYGERVKKLLDIMNTESTDDNVDIQDAKAVMNERLAIRKFKQNLFDTNVRMMALSVTHSDLYEAVSFANEKLEEMRMSNIRQEQPKTNANPMNNQQKFNTADKKEKMFCHICKRKNHMTKDCFSKKKNQQNDNNQSNKPNENLNKSFDGKKFNRAGKGRSMNQASGSNENESGDEAEEQIFEAEQMQLHTFGAHLNA